MRILIACVGLVLLTGCAAATTSTPGTVSQPICVPAKRTPSCVPSPAAVDAARVFAGRVVLPPGAVGTPVPAKGPLATPALRENSPALADEATAWTVPLAADAVYAFVLAHVPTDMRPLTHGTEHVSGATVQTVGDSVSPLPARLCYGQLLVSITRAGQADALVRVDGQAMDDCTKGVHAG